MGEGLAGFAFTAIAVIIAFFISPRINGALKIKIVILWLAVSFFAFLSPSKLLALVLMAVAMVIIAPRNHAERVYLFVASLAALPVYYFAALPFPGLNQLMTLDFSRLAAIVLLGPVFVTAVFSKAPKQLRSVDTALLLFVLLTGVMSIRDVPVTSMMRVTVYQFLLIYVPYIAITRSIKTVDELDTLVRVLLFSLVIIALIGVISTVQHWNYYAQLADFIQYKIYTETRNGFLRVHSTVNGTLLGYLMGVAAVCALYCRAGKSLPFLNFAACFIMFAAVTFVTGSRGGWLAAMIVGGLFVALTRFGPMLRRLTLLCMAGGVSAVLFLIFNESDVIQDEYGTFAYRAELLRTSMGQIASRPFFGETGLQSSPRFAHLIQGEGIVDFVNAYLQVVLFYGLVGFAFFIFAHFSALRGVLSVMSSFDEARRAKGVEEPILRRIAIVLVAGHLGYLSMILTVSAVSHTWHYGYVLLAAMVATVRVAAHAPATAPVVIEEPETEDGLASPASSVDRPKPYGARFVR